MIIALALAATIAPPTLGTTTARVHRAPPVPRVIVKKALAEASALWRASGLTFAWELEDDNKDGSVRATAYQPSSLLVVFDDAPSPDSEDHVQVLGWVLFDEHQVPQPIVHLSYTGAVLLLEASSGSGELN